MCDVFVFSIRVIFHKYVRKFSFISIFLKSLRRIGVYVSLDIWQNSPLGPSGLEFSFVGNFFITSSISLLVTGLFIFSTYSWVNFSSLCLPRNFSISSMLSNVLAYSCSQYSTTTLSISVRSKVMSLLLFLILEIWVFFTSPTPP